MALENLNIYCGNYYSQEVKLSSFIMEIKILYLFFIDSVSSLVKRSVLFAITFFFRSIEISQVMMPVKR